MKIVGAAVASMLAFMGLMAYPLQTGRTSPDLYGEAARAMLDRNFPSPRDEYLLLDVHENRVEAARWDHENEPIPVGSLFKPFIALAYADLQHNRAAAFPVITCHGASDGCWRAAGHGPIRLERAIAQSCNAYFLALARAITASPDGVQAMARISSRYGLPSPAESSGATADLIGLTPAWRVTPYALASAYATLLAEPRTTVTSRLRNGMRMTAAAGGTASRVGEHAGGVLAKTGTAPCVGSAEERCSASGDGLVVVAFPADEPRLLLLVRERGTTGAQAAATAGAMLSLLEKSDAMAH